MGTNHTGSVQVVALFIKRAGNLIVPSRTVPQTVLRRHKFKNRREAVLMCVDGRERSSDLSFMSATL